MSNNHVNPTILERLAPFAPPTDLRAAEAAMDEDPAQEHAAIEAVARLTAPGEICDPFAVLNFHEALAEMAAVDCGRISDLFSRGHVSSAGAAMKYAVERYWTEKARQHIAARQA